MKKAKMRFLAFYFGILETVEQFVHVFHDIVFKMIGSRMFGIKLCREFTF